MKFHGGQKDSSDGISLGLFPVLASRMNLLESSKISFQAVEAKKEVLAASTRMTQAHKRVSELSEELGKVSFRP